MKFVEDARPLIAYLADSIGSTAEPGFDTARGFWEGMQAACAQQDCHLLTFLNVGGDGAPARLLQSLPVDSADIYISWIRSQTPATETWFESLATRVHLCLSLGHRSARRVLIANSRGFEDLFRHLFEVHGFRRIAMIRGPENQHPAALARYQTCLAMLTEYGLEIDPQRFSEPGDWSVAQGRRGVCCLMDERGLLPGRDFDVIVCASDRIAMGALEELARRGIEVPRDVAMTGFNNLQEAQCRKPSLTSVSNPFKLQAIHAVGLALHEAGLRRDQPDEALLNSVLAVGESCGCADPHLHIPYRQSRGRDFRRMAQREADEILRRDLTAYFLLLRVALPDVGAQCDRLIAAYYAALREERPERFCEAILPELRTGHYAYMDMMHWQDVFSLFQHLALHADDESQHLAAHIIDMARVAVSDRYARGQTAYQLEQTRISALLRDLGQRLVECADLDALCADVAATLPLLGIPHGWLVFLEEGGQARLGLALVDGQAGVPESAFFDPGLLLPPQTARPSGRQSWVVCPVRHGAHEYGFVILAATLADGDIYGNIARVIADGVQGIRYRNELELRARQLESSLIDLYQTQEKLVETARMAALGELVTGLAHELNTPLGIGVTLATTLSSEAEALQAQINRGQVQKSAVLASLSALDECAITLLRNLQRASGLVDNFKQISIDQTKEECRQFDLADYLRNLVGSFGERLGAQQVEVTLEGSSSLPVKSYPGAYALIVGNLLQNSLQHGLAGREQGKITLTWRQDKDGVELVYVDNGKGMNAEVQARMYNPFFTTQRAQGSTGLGMHIVYSQVTQVLGGTIACDSAPGRGVKFTLRLPACSPNC